MKLKGLMLVLVIVMFSMTVFAGSSHEEVVAKIKDGTLSFNVALGSGDITWEEAIEAGILLKTVMETGEIEYIHMQPGPYSHLLSYYTTIPEFKAETIEGKEITQDYFKQNELTLVELWGTFCSPCIAKMKTMDKLNSKYQDYGFTVLGIVIDGDEEADVAEVIVEKKGVEYDNILANKELNDTLLKNVIMVPYSFFVDNEGNILRCFGLSYDKDFERVIEVLLGIEKAEKEPETTTSTQEDTVAKIREGKLSLSDALESGQISFDEAVKAKLLKRKANPSGQIVYTTETERPVLNTVSGYKQMPEFKAKSLSGKELTEDYFKNSKLTMVNIWGTFCSPCIAEMGMLDTLNSKYKDRGFSVLGIITDGEESPDMANYIVRKKEVKFENISANSELNNTVLKNVTGVPLSFFVDSEGNIVGEKIHGAVSREEYERIIEQLLNGIG